MFGPWSLDVINTELIDVVDRPAYVILRPSLEVCLDRALTRRSDPRHAGALNARGPIEHLYRRFCDLGPLEHHVLDNSSLSPAQASLQITRTLSSDSALMELPRGS